MRLSKNSKRNVKNGQSHRINNSSGITCFYSQMFFLILNNILFFGFFYKHLKECRNKKTPMISKTPTTLFFSWFRCDLYLIVSLAYQGGNSHEIKNIWLYFGRHYRKCNSIENIELRKKFHFLHFFTILWKLKVGQKGSIWNALWNQKDPKRKSPLWRQ